MSTNKRRKLNVAEPQQGKFKHIKSLHIERQEDEITYFSLAVSAFALRKKLLSQQATPKSAEATQDEEIGLASPSAKSSQSNKSKDLKKSRKDTSAQTRIDLEKKSSTSLKDQGPLSEYVPVGNSAVPNPSDNAEIRPSPPTTDDEDEVPDKPVKVLPIQLSSFKPSKNNYQMRKDGRIVLKLSDGEVCHTLPYLGTLTHKTSV